MPKKMDHRLDGKMPLLGSTAIGALFFAGKRDVSGVESTKPYLGFLVFTFCVIFAIGCYSPERNLSLDPHNKPLVHVLESQYDLASGNVLVKWEYIGTEPVRNFDLQRRTTDAFEVVAHIDGNMENPSYTFTSSYQDEALWAGETVFYRIEAQLAEGGREATETVSVVIPGAQATGILRDPVNISVQFQWQPDPAVGTNYRVTRTVNGIKTYVFDTENLSNTVYLDEDISSNALYSYEVETVTQSGRILKSRPLTAQFYRQATTQPVETVLTGSERLRLGVGEVTTSGGTLALVSRTNQIALYQFRYQIGLSLDGSPRVLRTLHAIDFPQTPVLDPLSVGFSGPLTIPSFLIFPRVYIGGILANGQIDISGFEMPLFNHVWSMSNDWVAPNGAKRVSLARDETERVYAAVGNELRVFSDFGSVLGNVFATQNIEDMTIQNNQIWLVLEDGSVIYGDVAFDQGILGQINWNPLFLPTGSSAVALSHNSLNQVAILDAGLNMVHLFNSDGSAVIDFGLPTRDYSTGDVVIDQSAGNLVQVTDGAGDITTFVP